MTATLLNQLADRVRAAGADHTRLRIAGGGSKAFYGNANADAALDMRVLSGITAYEPSELVVTARAGTSLGELEAALAEKGQCLPFEPPHFRASQDASSAATVGGMVAAGLAGPARASVGSVRDFVLGAQLLDGRGRVLHFGGTVMKNVAGYDVSRLLAGSLGILGCITEVSLKVLPRPPGDATLRFECSQEDALELLNGWGGRPLPLNSSRWAAQGAGGSLWLRLRGATAAVETACSHLGGERLDTDAANTDWRACRDQLLPWFTRWHGLDLWRLSVPQTAPVIALLADLPDPLIEWHGGLRWYFAPPDSGDQLRAAARDAGGHATLFRPGAASLHQACFDALSPALQAFHKNLKREFDPAGVFNHGRLYHHL